MRNMKGRDYCGRGDCRLCWSRISIFSTLIGLFLWVMAAILLVKHITVMNLDIFWLLGFSVPLGVLICRAYFSSARLTKYFFSKESILVCLFLSALFSLIPILDIVYLKKPKRTVIPNFFVKWLDIEEIVEELRYHGYRVKDITDKGFSVQYSGAQCDVSLCGNTICVAHNGQSAKFSCCIFDNEFEISNKIIALMKKGCKT